MKDRSDNPSHHERTLLPRSYTIRFNAVGLCASNAVKNLHIELLSRTQMHYIVAFDFYACFLIFIIYLKLVS